MFRLPVACDMRYVAAPRAVQVWVSTERKPSVKRWIATVSAAAMSVALLAPIGAASAQEDPGPADPVADPPGKTVAESETGSYIVVMEADPLVATIAPDDLDTPAADAQAAVLEETHDAALADAGLDDADKVQDYTNALNGFSAVISHDEAVKLAGSPDVAMVLPDELRHITKNDDPSNDFLGLTGPGRAYASGLTGEDVVVGVIDTGIWPEHPSFADDGSYGPSPLGPLVNSAARPSCDFGNVAQNANDAPFTCNNKLLGARQMLDTYRAVIGAEPDEFDSARDDEGHGTHTASTAAGNAGVEASILGREYGEVSGIAPRARVIAYKGLGNLGGFTSDLAAAIDQAVADGVDVINYSVGGGANLATADAIAYLFAARAGVWVATSAGNSGPDPATIGGPADVPWITAVGASTQERFFEGTVELGSTRDRRDNSGKGNGGDRRGKTFTGASVTPETDGALPLVDATSAGSDLCLRGDLKREVVEGKIVLCRRGATGRAEKGLAVFEAGGAGMILYNNTDSDNLFSDTHWLPAVHVDNTDGVQIKQYIASQKSPTARIRSGDITKFKNAPSTTFFSSRGENPAAPDIIKPDITAPGLQILAGASPFTDPETVPGGQLFQAIAGTSMSSPHVAGYYALLKQAHPDWTPAMAKSAIMTTADPKVLNSDQQTPAGPFDMGAGHLNPGKVAKKGSSFNPGLVYDAGFADYLAFLCGATTGVVGSATCNSLAAAGFSSDASDLNLPSIGIAELLASQTVTRTVTSVADRTVTWKADVHAPAGYDAVVEPSTITLEPGASVSYTVTFTANGTVPPGEWTFGDLVWKGNGGYAARSPIALKSVPIAVPAELAGTGTDGSLSFDVDFGYTGPYTAAPHGLVPEVLLSGNVSQDPDQTYPSADDGAGVVKIPFPLAGAAFARIALAIPGAPDIDLYLLDAAGNTVASSTNGGTDEQIDLELPADGNYTLVVHGWAVPGGGPLPFNISTWVVPVASGGSLVVDDAPTEAVIGTSGTVQVSWSGLDPDGNYLGAVSHSDGTGVLGLTLIAVDS